MFAGIAASPGIAIGKVLKLQEVDLTYDKIEINKEEVENEKDRFHQTIKETKEQLQAIKDRAERELGADKAEIFQAHLLVLEDPELINRVENKIEEELQSAEASLEAVVQMFVTTFSNLEDEYMQERAADIQDVGTRILKNLLGIEIKSLAEIDEPVILMARDLTPSDTAQIDKGKVLGFATEAGGRTSHTAIMARSLEIPSVVGLGDILAKTKKGDKVIVDALNGKLIINPTSKELAKYEAKKEEYAKRKEELAELKNLPAETKDGHRVEVAANIGTPKDVPGVLRNGGEGIGLYRTEFLYMDRKSLPTEEEQFNAYKEISKKLENRPVIIRTLDIGGDKELSYLDLPEEMNPFLGYRAIRICLDRPDIFKTQLRAILRASAYGNIKIMYPMISSIEELRAANAVLEEVKTDLKEEEVEFDEELEVGMMMEVPAAAMTADILAKEADFFSIGTNDLIQYTTAVDRMNENISKLYKPFHPAILRLIKRIIDAAHKENKWVGMCGEMAGDARLAPVLLGFGLDEFSMSAISIPEVKEIIRSLTLTQTEEIADDVLQLETAAEIIEYLDDKLE
ncbi:phosphoenolpyruvate--protein phosphotransferase [Selenihalanaerobacter shriftii]|uniref:Phosphoenolpyruvate-protein phosphotransferase n=1 Tax=Selenihalanaerobacter shriftii TaxID=142842 RepID=A0A1T4PRQ6_9FIRM|nr:phosphoenolpyruvate--protein phosphotransferase [Selenihalanaerobacter shriftii]SJZ94324.1 phosphoenolpyruvate--protein phosphotransferase [Selenihalanaerobacter shriftii]